MSFTHLQVRSGYSFYKSTMTVDKLVERAQELNYSSLALTDEGVLYGAISFYQACEKRQIKPIIGLVVDYVLDPETQETLPLILLAKNNLGYEQLIQISTNIQFEREWIQLLAGSNLIGIVSTENHSLKSLLMQEDFIQFTKKIEKVADSFHEDDFYVGVELYEGLGVNSQLQPLKQFADQSTLQFTALHDARYLEAKDAISYDCLQAIEEGKEWTEKSRANMLQNRHLRSKREMMNAFAEWPELLEETEAIAERCNVSISFDEQRLPTFPVPTNETAASYLKQQCIEQIATKYNESERDKVNERLEYELRVITQLHFSDYFLIVADFVQYAKQNNIAVGPGRGSAAGSIVAYLLGITNVDPLKHQLLFERFLNPERVTMPDIDIDFSDNRRDEVIDYVQDKYGAEYVSQIVTFGTYAARSVLNELIKVMNIDENDKRYMYEHIPSQGGHELLTYIKASEDFQAYIKQTKTIRQLFSIALTLEGLPRHISTHAAGIVVGEKPLINHVPLTKGSNHTHLTQYAMNELEAIGLLKIDILGLRNLTLIERIVQSIYRLTGEAIDIDALPENDPTVFKLLQAGKTKGIFQLESAGMKNVLLSLQPTELDDIIALNALYRPGPMDYISTYVQRKHGKEAVHYIHPDLEPILKPTYGVLIYQEQIMQITHEFAGLSLGEADILRRAISKKDHALIDTQKQSFIAGCKRNGYEEDVAEELFSWIEKFADYGFNKSHSVAYSKIAYQLAYLKTHYPTFFFAHLLSTVRNDPNKLYMYVKEASFFNINILPPSINQSQAYYQVEGNDIRIGLMAIKGIGYDTVQKILEARKERKFTDLFDFCVRVHDMKRNVLETLVLAGTFDDTYANRASLLASIDQALERAVLFGGMSKQSSLFKHLSLKPEYTKIEDFTTIEKLNDEKDLLNMYVSSHPIKQYRARLAISGYEPLEQLESYSDNKFIKTVGIVQSIKTTRTRHGDLMAFITITDETGEIDAVVFPKVYEKVSNWLKEDKMIDISGKINERRNKKQIVIQNIQTINIDTLKETGELYIRLQTSIDGASALNFLQKIREQYKGDTLIIIYNENEKKSYKLENKYSLNVTEAVMDQLKQFFGSENVVLKS